MFILNEQDYRLARDQLQNQAAFTSYSYATKYLLNITEIFVKCSFHAADHKYKDTIFNRNSILSATCISYLFYGKSVIVFASVRAFIYFSLMAKKLDLVLQ